MKSIIFSRLLHSLRAVLGVALITAPTAMVFGLPDPSTLTITVEELANGSVQFSASGTAYANGSGTFSTTPSISNPSDPSPPHTLSSFTNLPLPSGIVLTIPEQITSEEEPVAGNLPEAAEPRFVDLPVTSVFFGESGDWALGEFGDVGSEVENGAVSEMSSSFVTFGDPITGSGSVTVSNIPFSNFVPGVFPIIFEFRGEPESRERGFLFEITYKVIAYNAPPAPPVPAGRPALSVETPRPFPKTRIERSSRTQRVRITNVGKVPVNKISVAITGDHAGDFKTRPFRVRTLNPGVHTFVAVYFRPADRGDRKATLSVSSSAPEKSVPLSGTGVLNSPRFPRGL